MARQPAGRPELVEVRQELLVVAAIAEEMDLVGDLDLVAEADEPLAVRPRAEDQQVGVVANHLQQIGRPDGVFAAAVRLQPAGPTDQADRFRQAQPIEDLPSRGVGGAALPAPLEMTSIFSAAIPCPMQ